MKNDDVPKSLLSKSSVSSELLLPAPRHDRNTCWVTLYSFMALLVNWDHWRNVQSDLQVHQAHKKSWVNGLLIYLYFLETTSPYYVVLAILKLTSRLDWS